MDARRSRPARSSTSLFDQLGDTSSTGTLQASSAQRIPRRAAALLEKMGCCSRGPWSAFPWSWRPPRSSTGKTKVVGLVELSMPAPLHYAHYDGITMHYLALCDPPTGGPTYCRPLSGCRLPENELCVGPAAPCDLRRAVVESSSFAVGCAGWALHRLRCWVMWILQVAERGDAG